MTEALPRPTPRARPYVPLPSFSWAVMDSTASAGVDEKLSGGALTRSGNLLVSGR